jgi:hypothetical protein
MDLLHMRNILLDFLQLSPTATLQYTTLRQAFHEVLVANPDIFATLKQKDDKLDVWSAAGNLADAILCGMNHTRRLRNPIRWAQATSRLDPELVHHLEKLRDGVRNTNSMAEVLPTQELLEQVEGVMDDDASETEMLHTQDLLDASFEDEEDDDHDEDADSLLKEALCASPVPTKKAKIEQAIEAKKLVAMEAKKKPAAEMAVSMKKPATSQGFHSSIFGKLFLTFATHQSYIQYMFEGKKILLAAFSQKQSSDHGVLCRALATWVCKQTSSLTKADVVAKRDQMVK